MAAHADASRPSTGDYLTVLVSVTSTSPENCLGTLQASGIDGTVERFNFTGDEPLVQAAIRLDRTPVAMDFDDAAKSVGDVLASAGISYEIRGTGFNTAGQ